MVINRTIENDNQKKETDSFAVFPVRVGRQVLKNQPKKFFGDEKQATSIFT